jgi:hypothetical protein
MRGSFAKNVATAALTLVLVGIICGVDEVESVLVGAISADRLLRFEVVVEALLVVLDDVEPETKALTGLTVADIGVVSAWTTPPPVRMSKPMSVCKISRFLTCNMHVFDGRYMHL